MEKTLGLRLNDCLRIISSRWDELVVPNRTLNFNGRTSYFRKKYLLRDQRGDCTFSRVGNPVPDQNTQARNLTARSKITTFV